MASLHTMIVLVRTFISDGVQVYLWQKNVHLLHSLILLT